MSERVIAATWSVWARLVERLDERRGRLVMASTHARSRTTVVVATASLGLFLASPILMHAVGVALSPLVLPVLQNELERLRIAIVEDQRGRQLGIAVPAQLQGAAGPRLASEVPPLWRDLVLACEDGRLDGSYWGLGGVDPLAVVRATGRAIVHQELPGAVSTLPMQVVRLLGGELDPAAAGFAVRLWAKPHESLRAMVLRARTEPEEIVRLYAERAVLAVGLGKPVAGLEHAARLVFGRSLADLDPAELAMLAGATRNPILVTSSDAPEGRRATADKQWQSVRARARYCARLARPDDLQLKSAIAVLPRPTSVRHAASAVLDEDAARHPARRLASLGGGGILRELRAEARIGGRPELLEMGGTVRLALDLQEQISCEGAARVGIERFEAARGHLMVDGPAEWLVVASDERGRIRCLLSRGTAKSRLDGPPSARSRDRYDAAADPFLLGSVAKLVLALAVASKDSPETPYCNRAVQIPDGRRLRNPGGDTGHRDCSEPEAWHPATEVFGKSLSLPAYWRARLVGERPLAGLLDELGMAAVDGASPSYAIAFGLVRTSPRRLLHLLQSITACVEGAVSPMPVPRLILEPKLAEDPLAARIATAVARRCTQSARRFLAEVLSVFEPGTTLAASNLAPDQRGIVTLIGKTGTVETARRETEGILATAGIGLDGGGRLAILVRLQTPNSSRPLGRKLAGGHLAPVVDAVVESLRRNS